MKTLIKLKIEKFCENNKEYFLPTSNDLEGLVAEGTTIEEVLEIAQDVARILLDLEKETNSDLTSKTIPTVRVEGSSTPTVETT